MMGHTSHELVDWLGYMTHHEVDAMQNLVELLPMDALIVKIGAGAGTDTIAILEMSQDLLIFSIDILAGERPETTNEHIRLEENGYSQTGNVIRIWGDSKVVGKRWMFPIDWLHIDGDHSYDGIHGDLSTWLRHVRSGGIVSFHDYGDNHWPDVKTVVDRFMSGHILLQEYTVDKFISFRKRE